MLLSKWSANLMHEKRNVSFCSPILEDNLWDNLFIEILRKGSKSEIMKPQRMSWKFNRFLNFIVEIYSGILKTPFSIFLLSSHTFSKRKQILLPRKIYSVDMELSLFLSEKKDDGRLTENLVFLEILRRREKELFDVFIILKMILRLILFSSGERK